MKATLIFILVYTLIGTSYVYADDDPETPWPVEQRCVPDPVQPPEDWTFDGTIIATGWAGIHGMNAAWDTPHILAFKDGWLTNGGGGKLSPDGRWYVVPQATYRVYNSFGDVDVTQLLFYDLKEGRVLRKEWKESYGFFDAGVRRHYTYRTPVWLDNETVIYQRGETYYSIHVPDLAIEEWFFKWIDISPLWLTISHPAPDLSRIVVRISGEMELLDTEIYEFIANVYGVTFTADLAGVAWHPDASEFVISGALFTRLYNADGEILHTISLPPDENIHNGIAIRSNAYSTDGARFYVLIDNGRDYPEQYRLAVADRLSLTVTDTCMVFHSSAQFSPDGRHMALLSYAPGRQELLIFDIENWRLYRTGIYHDGEIIGWRED